MGIDSVIQCVSEFVTFYLVEVVVIRRIGHVAVMVIALFFYMVHFINYALVTNPWGVLFSAVLRGEKFGIIGLN